MQHSKYVPFCSQDNFRIQITITQCQWCIYDTPPLPSSSIIVNVTYPPPLHCPLFIGISNILLNNSIYSWLTQLISHIHLLVLEYLTCILCDATPSLINTAQWCSCLCWRSCFINWSSEIRYAHIGREFYWYIGKSYSCWRFCFIN